MKIQREMVNDEVEITLVMSDVELDDLAGSLNAGLWGDRYSNADPTVRKFLKIIGHQTEEE